MLVVGPRPCDLLQEHDTPWHCPTVQRQILFSGQSDTQILSAIPNHYIALTCPLGHGHGLKLAFVFLESERGCYCDNFVN